MPLGRTPTRERPYDGRASADRVFGRVRADSPCAAGRRRGFVEVALTYALVGVGVGFAHALLAVLVYRLFNFWLPIVPALALMPAIKRLRERFERAEQAA